MKEIKDKVYSIRLTKKEYEYIKEKAMENHCSMSQFIRTRLLKGVKL